MAPELRREQLLDAALSVIVDQGYSGVSIEAVARTAGVTRPVIYDHFPNLGRMLYALVEREERIAVAQLEHVVPEDPSGLEPPDLLAAGVRRFLDAVASRPQTWRIILLPPAGTPAIVRQHIETNRAQTLMRIERLVRWALEAARAPGLARRRADRARDPRSRRGGREDGADRSRALPARALRAICRHRDDARLAAR